MSTVNNSNLPKSIRNDRNSFAPSEKKEKFCVGSTSPIPGPMFPKQAILAPADVTMSCPKAVSTSAPIMNTNKYIKKKARTL